MIEITPNIEGVERIRIAEHPAWSKWFESPEADCWWAWVKFTDQHHEEPACNPDRKQWDPNDPQAIVNKAQENRTERMAYRELHAN